MFSKLTRFITRVTGHPLAVVLCFIVILLWTVAGFFYHFSDTWQLVMDTFSSIVTLLMVFLLQNSQNRETTAIQIKLNELIRAEESAHTSLIDIEKLSDKEIGKIYEQYEKLKGKVSEQIKQGKDDMGRPDV